MSYNITLHISTIKADGTAANHYTSTFVKCQNLGGDYAIYAFKVCPDSAKIAITVAANVYESDHALMTVNQPFTIAGYRKALGIKIENLYDVTKVASGHVNIGTTESLRTSGAWGVYCTSNVIEIQAGDTITFGPYWSETIKNKNPYTGLLYDAEKNSINGSPIYVNVTTDNFNCVEVGTIFGEAKIYSYTVTNTDAKYLRISTIAPFADCTLITKNLAFTAEALKRRFLHSRA